jgi:hypothetical protein
LVMRAAAAGHGFRYETPSGIDEPVEILMPGRSLLFEGEVFLGLDPGDGFLRSPPSGLSR